MHEPGTWQCLNDILLFPGENHADEGLVDLKKTISNFSEFTKAQVTSKLPTFKKTINQVHVSMSIQLPCIIHQHAANMEYPNNKFDQESFKRK